MINNWFPSSSCLDVFHDLLCVIIARAHHTPDTAAVKKWT